MKKTLLIYISPIIGIFFFALSLNAYAFLIGASPCVSGSGVFIPKCYDLGALPQNLTFFAIFFFLLLFRFVFLPLLRAVFASLTQKNTA